MEELYGWLKDAGIEEPNVETLPKHSKVIDDYEPDPKELIAFARVFFGFDSDGDPSLEKFGTALQTADPTFRREKHKQELSIFAGAELVSVIQKHDGGEVPDLAALCLVCGGAQGVRTGITVPKLVTIAARYIESRTSRRGRSQDGKPDESQQLEEIERELTLVGEESSMLWWLVSECSRDQNEPWKTVKLLASSIIAGKELADLTRVVPGPVAAPAFLDRILRLSNSGKTLKPVSIKEALEKTPRDWRELYTVVPVGLAQLCPISSAIKLSLTVSEGEDWSPVFRKGTALEPESKMPPTGLAYQTFLEHMLQRLVKELE
jgi:hypothetical protein